MFIFVLLLTRFFFSEKEISRRLQNQNIKKVGSKKQKPKKPIFPNCTHKRAQKHHFLKLAQKNIEEQGGVNRRIVLGRLLLTFAFHTNTNQFSFQMRVSDRRKRVVSVVE